MRPSYLQFKSRETNFPLTENLSYSPPLFFCVFLPCLRYGSVANHPNYGPVLFLFAYDEKAQNADLKNPQMIALMDCNVKLGRNVKSRDGRFKCEFIVSTAKKRHVFAAKDSIIRDYWIESIKKLA